MNLDVNYDTDSNKPDISLKLLITLANNYSTDLINTSEELADIDPITTDDDIGACYDLLTDDYVSCKTVLIIGDASVRENIDNLIRVMVHNISNNTDNLPNMYCMDSEENGVFSDFPNLFNPRLIGAENINTFLSTFADNGEEQYLFINEGMIPFFQDAYGFVENLSRIINTMPNIHVYFITTEPDLINEYLVDFFEYRVCFHLSSTKISKLLIGTNCACSCTNDNTVISRDYGTTYERNPIM